MAETLSYVHRFEKGTEADAHSVLLLHGTGGDENDLVPLGRMVAPGAPPVRTRQGLGERHAAVLPTFWRRHIR
jgi:phospholipase/carboxylesterase